MVIAGRTVGWTRRLLSFLQSDFRTLAAALRRRRGGWPRLRRVEVQLADRKRRLHLRTEADGTAVLLVDVTDAIHLSPVAGMLAGWALDGVSPKRAAWMLRMECRGLGREEAESAAAKVFSLVERLCGTAEGCPTCGLEEAARSAWFSIPVAAPYKADLALTYGCNNACSHCYNRRDPSSRQTALLKPGEWRIVLRRLASIGVPHVVFTGGEPTLVPALGELIDDATRRGLVAGLNTNGRRLARADYVESLRAAGLDHVQITLESDRADVHNAMTGAASFDETVQGIDNALRVGLHTLTNTTLTQKNIDGAGALVEFLHARGLRTFAMNGMIHAGRGLAHGDAVPVERLGPVLNDVRRRAARLGMRFLWYTPTEYCRLSPLELELGPRRCNAGEYSICIEPNGDVLPCQSYYVSAGNILRDPWARIWESSLFRGFRERVAHPSLSGLPERCWECPDLPLCAGGCRLEREGRIFMNKGSVLDAEVASNAYPAAKPALSAEFAGALNCEKVHCLPGDQ